MSQGFQFYYARPSVYGVLDFVGISFTKNLNDATRIYFAEAGTHYMSCACIIQLIVPMIRIALIFY